MWRTSGRSGGSWVPRGKMLTSKPRSSRPAMMDGPVGPVPPMTRADLTTRVRLLDVRCQKLIYAKSPLGCKHAAARDGSGLPGRVTTVLLVPHRFGASADCDGVDRAVDGPPDRQWCCDQHGVVVPGHCAVSGEILQIEHLADGDCAVRQDDLMQWRQGVGGFVGKYFQSPGVGGDRRDVVSSQPPSAPRAQPRRRPQTGIVPPVSAVPDLRELAGSDQHYVTGAYIGVLRVERAIEVLRLHRSARFQPSQSSDHRQVE